MTDIVNFCCDSCGRVILCDSVVRDEEWKRISPTNDEGGMLCASCIVDRLGYCAALISDAHSAQMTDEIEHLRLSLSEARVEVEDIKAKLKIPAAVRLNWLRGDIDCSNILSEARATGRREGMEVSARIAALHNNYAAAAIRAAMEKEE